MRKAGAEIFLGSTLVTSSFSIGQEGNQSAKIIIYTIIDVGRN
jgi:hypothetical protein